MPLRSFEVKIRHRSSESISVGNPTRVKLATISPQNSGIVRLGRAALAADYGGGLSLTPEGGGHKVLRKKDDSVEIGDSG
jgi:hypothetical protein